MPRTFLILGVALFRFPKLAGHTLGFGAAPHADGDRQKDLCLDGRMMDGRLFVGGMEGKEGGGEALWVDCRIASAD